jgi:hypothetical protein
MLGICHSSVNGIMASIAFRAGYSAIPADSVRSDQGFIREVFPDRNKDDDRPGLLDPEPRTKRDARQTFVFFFGRFAIIRTLLYRCSFAETVQSTESGEGPETANPRPVEFRLERCPKGCSSAGGSCST